jgi:hypothetical protein
MQQKFVTLKKLLPSITEIIFRTHNKQVSKDSLFPFPNFDKPLNHYDEPLIDYYRKDILSYKFDGLVNSIINFLLYNNQIFVDEIFENAIDFTKTVIERTVRESTLTIPLHNLECYKEISENILRAVKDIFLKRMQLQQVSAKKASSCCALL